jgi:predicted ATP-dependent serine protease
MTTSVPYEELASRFDSVQRVFIGKDSPEAARVGVQPESVTIDLARVDIKQLRAGFEARQADYDTAPFDISGELVRFYCAAVTIWSGFPGAGKSTLLRQLVCHLLKAKRQVFIASLEENPADLLWRLVQTAAGTPQPTDHMAQWFLDLYGEQLRIWNVVGASNHLDVLAAITAIGARHAIIDSLMALDVPAYDWEAQRLFAKRLVGCARMSGCHIHLVAHPRKPMAGDQLPDVHDVAGSADLGRLVDNVLFVRRRSDEPVAARSTRMQVLVRKQRHFTGACPVFDGWYHREYLQYHVEQWPAGATSYLCDHAYHPVRWGPTG